MEEKHGNPIAFLKWVAEFQDENGNYIELTGDRWHFSDKDDTDNVTEDQLWELYKLHYPDVEDQLATANETIKVLEYDNNRLKGEVEGLNRWKEETKSIINPIWEYADTLKVPLGESKTEAVVKHAEQARKLLYEVFRKHESGLLPDRFIYEKIKMFLYGE